MGRKKINDKVISIDPFDVSSHPTKAQMDWANWFVDNTNGNTVFHIRRIHYQTLEKLKPDGTKYENTVNDSALLSKASEYARYLELVDFDRVVDHKNAGLTVHTEYPEDQVNTSFDIVPESYTHYQIENASETITSKNQNYIFGQPSIYFDVQSRQPYHIEMWVEKSTMNDILIPIAEKYHASLVVASGQFSITNVKDLYKRIQNLNKPVRIFYIRDFDPAGETMARAVSRKLEWFLKMNGSSLDVKMQDVVLTYQQCVEFQLPRSPMDRTARYKENFENKFGEGATELDSLEALYPGELAKIVTDAISPYYDVELSDEIKEFQSNEEERYSDFKEQVIEEIIDDCYAELSPLIEKYNSIIEALNDAGNNIEALLSGYVNSYDFNIEIPDASKRVVCDTKKNKFLLDTERTYEEQLERYQASRDYMGVE